MIERDEDEQLAARPIVAGAIEALAEQGRRLSDVFLSGAIRRACRLLTRTDNRLAAAEDALAKVTAARDGLERQRDELRRELRAAQTLLEAARRGSSSVRPGLALAPAAGEPLAQRTAERDEARAARDVAIAELEAAHAMIYALRAQLEAAIPSTNGSSNGTVTEIPTAEAVLEARRGQLVAELDEITAKLREAAATPCVGRSREHLAWRKQAVVRGDAIRNELRDLNPRLKQLRIERNAAVVAVAAKIKGAAR